MTPVARPKRSHASHQLPDAALGAPRRRAVSSRAARGRTRLHRETGGQQVSGRHGTAARTARPHLTPGSRGVPDGVTPSALLHADQAFSLSPRRRRRRGSLSSRTGSHDPVLFCRNVIWVDPRPPRRRVPPAAPPRPLPPVTPGDPGHLDRSALRRQPLAIRYIRRCAARSSSGMLKTRTGERRHASSGLPSRKGRLRRSLPAGKEE